MACGICGSTGHNRRTHADHEAPQGEALIDQPGTGEPVAPTGAERARQALLAARTACPSDGFCRGGDHTTCDAGPDHPTAFLVGEHGTYEPEAEFLARGGRLIGEVDPAVLKAVGRIADEMDTPHGPGCTLADPCDECRRYVAHRPAVADPDAAEDRAYDTADRIAASPVYSDVAQLNYAAEDDPVHGTDVDPSSSVVPDEEDQPEYWQAPDGTRWIYTDLDGGTWSGWMPGEEATWIWSRSTFEKTYGTADGLSVVYADTTYPTPPWRTALGPDEPIRITEPGVYQLTAAEYHSFEVTGKWISNSDVKDLLKSCPAQFDYDRRHAVRKTSDAFDFGHVWHALILGKGELYRVFEPKKLDGRTKEGKAQKAGVDRARAEGFTPIYGDQFALIEAMAEAVKADPVPYGLLNSPGRSEVCLFWREQVKVTDPHNKLYGQVVTVQRRAMIDHLPDMPADPDETVILVDGKTAEDVKPDDDMRKKVYDYGYHRQADTYESAIRSLFGREAQVMFVFQSKKPPHLVVPVELDTPAMRVAAAQNHQALQVWAECVATGQWPGYVTNGIATSGVPAWIERQYEDEMVIG